MIQQVSYQTVGSNRQKPRLWIEGVKLGAAGFIPGARYDLVRDGDEIDLRLSETGKRKVSGKSRNGKEIPILDLILSDEETVLDIGTRVRVLFTHGTVRVSLHHEEKARVTRERAFLRNLAEGTLTEASMFTGGGVSTHAIHAAIADYGVGSKLAWVVDSELKYLQVAYANNYSINDDTVALIGRAEEIEPRFFTKVDLLSFSMPCSGFSRAGKAKHGKSAEEHEGAAALFGTLSAIRSANAAVLVSENVEGARDSAAYVLLRAELERIGYVIFERTMTEKDTGSMERRTRYWFIAISAGLAEGFDFSLLHEAVAAPRPAVRDILDHEVPEGMWRSGAYLKEKAARDAAAGKGFVRQILTLDQTSMGTIGKGYLKNRSTEPRLARADGMERLLTQTEHARAKSVPEHLIADVPATTAHEVLGQSVDWRQAYLVSACVMAHFTGRLDGAVLRDERMAA